MGKTIMARPKSALSDSIHRASMGVQIELRTPGVNPCRAMEQNVSYKNAPFRIPQGATSPTIPTSASLTVSASLNGPGNARILRAAFGILPKASESRSAALCRCLLLHGVLRKMHRTARWKRALPGPSKAS